MKALACCSSFSACSLTFAHSIRVPLELAVIHARDDVKQSENLLLGECCTRGHHQAPRDDITGAEVCAWVAAGIS